jgi:hypothetical protein
LTAPSGLLLVTSLDRGNLALDRLEVGHLGLLQQRLDAEFPFHLGDRDLDVNLPVSADEHLVRARVAD